jgi:hypothetical protein
MLVKNLIVGCIFLALAGSLTSGYVFTGCND